MYVKTVHTVLYRNTTRSENILGIAVNYMDEIFTIDNWKNLLRGEEHVGQGAAQHDGVAAEHEEDEGPSSSRHSTATPSC